MKKVGERVGPSCEINVVLSDRRASGGVRFECVDGVVEICGADIDCDGEVIVGGNGVAE